MDFSHVFDILFQESTLWAMIKICITLIITISLNSLLRSFIKVPKRLDTRKGRTYVSVTRNLITIVLFVIALNILLLILNINIAPLLASAGIVGLTLGIGARSLVEDLIAGFFLLSQDTVTIGDYVNIGGGSIEGTVEDIGFRSLKIRSANGALNIIPNGQIKQVINYSRGKLVSFIDVPVKTGQDLDSIIKLMEKIITQLAKDEEGKYKIGDDSQVLGVQSINAGSAMLIRVQIATTAAKDVVEREYRYRLIHAFEKAKIAFA